MSTDAGIIRTAFDGAQRKLGADFMDWEGWYWPNHFGDAAAEHRAVREDVGVWDESPLRKWDFSGPDALAAARPDLQDDLRTLGSDALRHLGARIRMCGRIARGEGFVGGLVDLVPAFL